jgi:hypothetical protein
VIVFSCKPEKGGPTSVRDNLVGKWVHPEISGKDRTFIEEWSKLNDSTYTGKAYALDLNTGNIMMAEELSLSFSENNWTYSASPSGQAVTEFKMSEMTPEHMRFENPDHDFPKYIEYRWLSADSLVAKIGDRENSRSFPMVRMKEK